MSNNKLSLRHRLVRERVMEEQTSLTIKPEAIENYKQLQKDTLKSEAYILSEKYNIALGDAEEALAITKNYSRTIYLTEYIIRVLNIDKIDYLAALKIVVKEGIRSLKRQPISMLEQEVMNLENKFGINRDEIEIKLLEKGGKNKTNISKKNFKFNMQSLSYRSNETDSSHYSEHMVTRALDFESN
jgi:hypothetical protein